jgi:hypothetical protein
MKSKALLFSPLLALIPTLFGRPSVGETIEHGELPPGNSVPEGSREICPGVPEDVDFIPHIRTGWAVAAGERVRVQFSDLVLACSADEGGGLMETSTSDCRSGWAFGFELPADLEPGTYELSEIGSNYTETMTTVEDGPGCSSGCSGSGVGSSGSGSGPAGGSGAPSAPKATLEIYSVNVDCIAGRISGFVSNQIEPPPPEFNGAFHAVRCTAEE